MKEKGFTLIELIAIVVILGIIALLTTPIIINMFVGVKKSNFNTDVKSVIKAGDLLIGERTLKENECINIKDLDVTHKEKFISGRVCNIGGKATTKKLCTNEFCHNGNNQSGTVVEYAQMRLPIMMKTGITNYYKDSAYKTNIVTATVLDEINVPSDAVISWDLSQNQDNSVIGWLTNHETETGRYNLYIAGSGGVEANVDSKYLFYGMTRLKKVDLTNLDFSKTNIMSNLFTDNRVLTDITWGDKDFSNVTDMSYMFYNCYLIPTIDLNHWNASKVTTLYRMFDSCKALTTVNFGNMNTSSVENMGCLFIGCSSLTTVNFGTINTSKVTDISSMFSSCSALKTIDLSPLNTSLVTTMANLFSMCTSLNSVNFGNIDTSQVTDMSSMFYNCKDIQTIDLSNLNTASLTNMERMFRLCSKLTSVNFGNFNTNNVTDMSYLFSDCKLLTSLNLTSFDTHKVSTMQRMFATTSVLNVVNVKTGKWITAPNYTEMFYNSNISEVTYNA